MPLPPQVSRSTTTFLAAIDSSSPGLVAGLYLHGSLGFGEFYPGHSDIDYVAVLARAPDADALAALAAAHQAVRERHPKPDFDGFHLLRQDLARPPEVCPDLPCTQDGVFRAAAPFYDVNPVTWHELARHGVTVRGPALTKTDVWTNDAALRAYSHDNLATYWSGVAQSLADRPDEASTDEATAWCVLGVSRLHHLLATGNLTSKSGAGRYALDAFEPRWRPIVTEALRIREASGVPSFYDGAPGRRGRDTTEFTAMAVEAGVALDPSLAI
ncbi:aminoglycoside adenylyltransferase domain-containing protein [Kitasatospora sp. NPDC094011]|uniref:aminoglycoside adenylyltransferase domain-containing protein n=1 Tax=Kitasatospora sp. NPDC094011 TaxID=3364090 RepID=UPI0037FD0B6F